MPVIYCYMSGCLLSHPHILQNIVGKALKFEYIPQSSCFGNVHPQCVSAKRWETFMCWLKLSEPITAALQQWFVHCGNGVQRKRWTWVPLSFSHFLLYYMLLLWPYKGPWQRWSLSFLLFQPAQLWAKYMPIVKKFSGLKYSVITGQMDYSSERF